MPSAADELRLRLRTGERERDRDFDADRRVFRRLLFLPFRSDALLPLSLSLSESDPLDEEELSLSLSLSLLSLLLLLLLLLPDELLEAERLQDSCEQISSLVQAKLRRKATHPRFFLSFFLSSRIFAARPAVMASFVPLLVTACPLPPNSAGVATDGLSPFLLGSRSCFVRDGRVLYTTEFLQS